MWKDEGSVVVLRRNNSLASAKALAGMLMDGSPCCEKEWFIRFTYASGFSIP